MSTDNFTCEAYNRNLTITPAAVFENTNWIVSGHNKIPRFGHTNNITSVITGNNQDVKNYVIGLSAASIAVFAFFCLWFVIVVVLKCMGYSVVGFLSGSNVQVPPPPSSSLLASGHRDAQHASYNRPDEKQGTGTGTYDDADDHDDHLQAVNLDGEMNESQEYNEDLEDWKEQVRIQERRIRNIRIAVIISGVIIIVMVVLMLVFGILSLNDSVRDGRDGLTQGENLTISAVDLIDNYLKQQNSTLDAARTVQASADQVICPELRDIVCADPDTFNCDDILNIDVPSSVVKDTMNQIYSELIQVRSDLLEAGDLMYSIDQKVSSFEWAFWVAAGAVILMAICTVLILNGVILAWKNKLYGTCWQRTTSRVRGWFIVPVFVFLLIVGWVFSMVFVMGYASTSDFCYNSPDENVQAILEENKDRFSSNSIVYPTLMFYISGCPRESQIFQTGSQFISFMLYYLDQATKGLDLISAQADTVASQCGTDPETLRMSLFVLESQLCTIADSIYNIVDFFTCENFNRIYATVAYSAVCYNGNTGFVWIAFTQLMIILCAMIMLTLRVAFYEQVDDSELIQPRRGCCPCGSRGKSENDGVGDDLMEDQMEGPSANSAKNPAEYDAQSGQSGDGFDEIVSSAVGQAFEESENGGNTSDGDERPTKLSSPYS